MSQASQRAGNVETNQPTFSTAKFEAVQSWTARERSRKEPREQRVKVLSVPRCHLPGDVPRSASVALQRRLCRSERSISAGRLGSLCRAPRVQVQSAFAPANAVACVISHAEYVLWLFSLPYRGSARRCARLVMLEGESGSQSAEWPKNSRCANLRQRRTRLVGDAERTRLRRAIRFFARARDVDV